MNNEIVKDGNDFIVKKDLTKEQKTVNKAYSDTFKFLKENTESWADEECCGSYVCFGMISAMLQTIFSLAPNKKDAMAMIRTALYNEKISIMFEEIEEDKDKKEENKNEK